MSRDEGLIPPPRIEAMRRLIASRLERKEAPSVDLRVAAHPYLPPREKRRVVFVFEGRPVEAYEGESVAAALLAAGVRTLSRSLKYHRPRGVLCGSGWCPTCSMRVDGLPGVRTCVTPVRQGMVVERDRPWRTGERDALRALELAGPLAGAGFYYRRFTDSPRAYRVWERLLANLAAAGRLPDAAAARLCRSTGVQTREVDVCVVGGGAAGVAAALAAARAGRAALLIERDDEVGGALLAETRTLAELDATGPACVGHERGEGDAAPGEGRSSVALLCELVGRDVPPDLRGFALAGRLAEVAAGQSGLEVLLSATAQAWGDEGVLLVETPSEPVLVSARTLVVAAGTRDRKVAFPGGDLPGVMLARGVQRLLHRDRVRPGVRAVVATDGAIGYAVAHQLLDAGVEVTALADARAAQDPAQADPARAGLALSGTGPLPPSGVGPLPLPDAVPVFRGHAVEAAHGFGRLRGVTLAPVGGRVPGRASRRDARVECDALCLALGEEPADELVAQYLAHGSHSLGRPPLRREAAADHAAAEAVAPSPTAGLWLAGALAGPCSLAESLVQGVAAGEQAARASSAPS